MLLKFEALFDLLEDRREELLLNLWGRGVFVSEC